MNLSPNMIRILRKALMQPGYAIKVGAKRIEANIYYRFGNGLSGMPESLTLFLTHRCNLRCRMCGQWGEAGVTRKRSAESMAEELSMDLLKSTVDDLAAFSPSLTLFGGEPLLYKGCLELIRYIKSKRMHCLMITNGSLMHEHAAEIVASGLDELNVSLDGQAEAHDRIRGMPGLFDKIMSGLDAIKSIKASGKKNRPLVNIQCTINAENYHSLENMTEVALRAGADSLTFHNLIFTNKRILSEQRKFDELLGTSSEDWNGFDFDPGIDPEALHKKMARIVSGKHSFSVDFYPNFSAGELKNYYRDPLFRPSGYTARCLSPWIAAYVFPNGELRPCLNCAYSYGNIKEAPVSKIWNSDKAVKYRQALKENRIFPACVRCTELYRY